MDNRLHPLRTSQRLLTYLVCGLVAWQPLLPAMSAAITPVTGGTQMDKAANGVPVMNIATPNGAGISHNQFKDYNVGKEGLILNNATGQLNQTQLGGLIQNNPNLRAGQEARGIINEVTGGSRSQLQGYTEVAGKAANVIVANPYGITCDGCGFINTPNATLTTGKPQFDDKGNLSALNVTGGTITVEGKGLDASQSDALSIISRATEVNAAIHAKDLNVTVGAVNGEGPAPTVAVDTGALGGMYANRIHLVSSEKGVGVNLGNLTARQGDISLDANGKLVLNNSLSGGALTVKSEEVALSGSHKADGAMDISSSRTLDLQNASLASGADTRLSSNGRLAVNGGGVSASGTLQLDAKQDMAISGATLVSQKAASLNSTGKLDIVGGSLTSKDKLNVAAGRDLIFTHSTVGSNADVSLSGNGALSATGSNIAAGRDLVLNADNIELDNSSRATASGALALTAADITSQAQIDAGGDLSVTGRQVVNGGQLGAKGRLDMQSTRLENGGVMQGHGVRVNSDSLLNQGTLVSGSTLGVTVKTLDQQGSLSATGDADIRANESLNNSGTLLAGGAMTVQAGTAEQNGTLSGDRGLSVNADSFMAGKKSITSGQGDVSITAAQNISLSGQVNAAGALGISGKRVATGEDGHLQSGKDLTISADEAMLHGVQAAKGALGVAAVILGHSGKSTGSAIDFNGSQSVDNGGELLADTVAMHGRQIIHSGSVKADRISLFAPEQITSSGALVADNLALESQIIINSGLLQGVDALDLKTDVLENLAQGSLYSAQDLLLDIPQFINRGLVTTDSDLRLKGERLLNDGEINGVNLSGEYASLLNQPNGRILADNILTLAGGLIDSNGLIAADSVSLTGKTLKNQGDIQSARDMVLNTEETTNGGSLRAGRNLTLEGDTLSNSGELSATTLLLNLNRALDNQRTGKLVADEKLDVTVPEVVNRGLLVAKILQLKSDDVNNSGLLQGTALLMAKGDTLVNQQEGKLLTAGALELNNSALTNAGLLQGNTLNLATGEWSNTGRVQADSGLTAQVSRDFASKGSVKSQQDIDIRAAHINNAGELTAKTLTLRGDLENEGLLQGEHAVNWDGSTFINRTNGQIVGGASLKLTGNTLKNQGQIEGRVLALAADSLVNSGNLQAQESLSSSLTGRLENQGVMLSQDLFELAASALFNDGSIAARNLTLTVPQLVNNGLLQGNDLLQLTSRELVNGKSGQLVSHSGLSLDLNSLQNSGLVFVNDDFTLIGNQLVNDGDIQADTIDFALKATLSNQGNLVAKNNSSIDTAVVDNGGLIQGSDSVTVTADDLNTRTTGRWLAGKALTVNSDMQANSGVMQGETLNLTARSVDNSGVLHGLNSLSGVLIGELSNSGQIQSGGRVDITADRLLSSGRVTGDKAVLSAGTLSNDGLWQGRTGLQLIGNTISTGAMSRTLSGGELTLDAGEVRSNGILQGQHVVVKADDWSHEGSLVSHDSLSADVNGTLTTSGELMSKGILSVAARVLDNRGQIVSENDVTLYGQELNNNGSVQGNTLTVRQGNINNQGTLTGQQSLTLEAQERLMARMAMAAPQRVLINGTSGALLTEGVLTVKSGVVSNAGTWQGQSVMLDAQSLTNSGILQSAGEMQLALADDLTSVAGSKIIALGAASLQASSLSNQGQWAAKNLTLKGSALNNNGAISGVEGLQATLTGAVNQQQNGSMLTGGALNISAASVTNEGKSEGDTLSVTAEELTNSGRLQGDAGLILTLKDLLTNREAGEIVSAQGLTAIAPTLFNYGLIQGRTDTKLSAAVQANNDGKLFSGANLTLDTSLYSGTGWLQATNLILNAAKATSSGSMIADEATLTGDAFTNQGTTQAGLLRVNYAQLTNNGTLLGANTLNVNADQVVQGADGRLFSGGDMRLESQGLDALGQLVSLGNMALKVATAFTGKTTVAAGKSLDISSDGAIDNRGVMQGQTVNLTAGGALVNNGQITTGNGASTFSGSSVAFNIGSSIQGGGDIAVVSRNNIRVDGFSGTRGSLTLSAPGTITNTSLLYAGNNLALYADGILNQSGDILAGNSLWLQKDAAGNASKEVINKSGNIETHAGDIIVKADKLFNGYESFEVEKITSNTPGSSGQLVSNARTGVDSQGPYIIMTIHVDLMPEEIVVGGGSSETVNVKTSGAAARINAGNNAILYAGSLDNQASYILSGKDISLTGNSLNNQTVQSGSSQSQAIYKATIVQPGQGDFVTVTYRPGNVTTGSPQGTVYRGVIQAAGNVTAKFANNIGNTSTIAGAGKVSGAIAVPTLNTLSHQSIGAGVQKQGLTSTGIVPVNSPEWRDRLQDALVQISGGDVLDGNDTTGSTLTNAAAIQKDRTSLGQLNGLTNTGATTASLSNIKGSTLGVYQGKAVDTSAYPLPYSESGYFVVSENPKSPYLITVNPKLNGLGQLDPALFNDLNTLLNIKPDSAPQETRNAYTDEQQFLGSSYMLGRLGLNPDYDYRFLGDAAFDSRYVSNTLLNRTGSRYINGIGSELEQMRYLMDSAAAAQQSLGLQFGVSLTADQIASLDHSILWWEAATINGETVMIPKLYLSPKDITVNNGGVIAGNNVTLKGDTITNDAGTLLANNALTLNGQNSISNLSTGLLKAGGDLSLNAIGDINNISAAISGKSVQLESVEGSINNLTLAEQIDINTVIQNGSISLRDTVLGSATSITAQNELLLNAGKNITATGASLASGGDMLINAAGDISVNANQKIQGYSASGRNSQGSETKIALQRSSINSDGNISIKAGNDATLNAVAINAGKDIQVIAGNDTNLLSSEYVDDYSLQTNSKTIIDRSVRQQGTEIISGGNAAIVAGRDVNMQAAGVVAQDDIGVKAGRDLALTTATESDYSYREEKKSGGGLLSKKTTTTIQEDSATREKGTLLSGTNVSVEAGKNILVNGSQVVGDEEVALKAGDNIDILAATNTNSSWRFSETKKSGLMGSGGIGFTIGSSKTTHDLKQKGTTQSQSVSTVGSTGGNVTIASGGQVHLNGSDVVAGKGITVDSDNVLVTAGHDKNITDEIFKQKTAGLTLALSGTVGDAINSAVSAAQSASTQSDSRLAALQGAKAALSGYQAAQAVRLDAANGSDPSNGATVGIMLSLGAQSSKSQSHSEQDTTRSATLNAGNNLTLTASGKGKTANSGDINVEGGQLKAGQDVTLDAARDITLQAAKDTQMMTGSNSSKGGSIGVGLTAGSGGTGITVSASVNASKGNQKGNGTSWNETNIDAGNQVTLNSGRDTALSGALVNGDKVVADVGRDLTVASLQDSNNYDSKQQSVSAGASFTWGVPGASASFSYSRDKMKSTYDSVQEQSGIYAGKGGFDITVGSHTQLDGAVLASTAEAEKNRLDTGTLGFSDIHNEADYKVEHQGVGLSTSGSTAMQGAMNLANNLLASAGGSGHAEGTTQAAVADGAITIRDQANQRQDVADLSRDTANANGAIGQIFDKEKEQKRLQAAQMIGELGSQMAQVARTEGQIAAITAGKAELAKNKITEPAATDTKGWEDYNKKLVATPAYKDAMDQWGTGSTIQRAIQATTAAVQGLAGGDIAAALAGGAAPFIANVIAQQIPKENLLGRTLAHATVNAALAAAQGKDMGVAAAGAATGEIVASIARDAYGKSINDLDESQKQTVSTLATLASALAGGLIGGSGADAMAAAQVGKTTAENNALASEMYSLDRKVKAAKAKGEDITDLLDQYRKVAEKDRKELEATCKADPDTCGFSSDIANDAYSEYLANGAWLNIDPDVVRIMSEETAKDNAVIKANTSEFGKGLVIAAEGASILVGAGTSFILPGGKKNPLNIATSFTKSPQAIWGRSTDDIVKDFQSAGYQTNLRQSNRGSSKSVIIEVKGHPEISQVQYHPGGGRHGGSYYKVSTTTQGTIKVVDPATYKPTLGEKATIINKPKR